ncbi:translational machinery component [Gonapodya prolifera JEL478]|uniref:Translational machinery component n=1 Tax=Gonapodya prolifera (strain JEL478) TaxID=1344416 RepID=A0A139ARH1_GONPJ|nr:translational machinery component [Gonapodya prolifera JEL478]|eukprot:KXS19095.1 translational machinery component [Gonapodya prolifera JEL478]
MLPSLAARILFPTVSSPACLAASLAKRGLGTGTLGHSRCTPTNSRNLSSSSDSPSTILPYEPSEALSPRGESLTADLFSTPLARTPAPLNTSIGSLRPRSALDALLSESRDPTSGLMDPRSAFTPPHIVTITARRGNTHVGVADPYGRTLCVRSAGKVGFKKANRGSPDAAYAVCLDVVEKLQDVSMPGGVALRLDGFGAGRDQSFRAFRAAGWRIVRLEDITSVRHGGCRPPKRKRR